MRIDSHQHFWHYDPAHHVWMTEAMATLRRDYLPDELAPLLRAAGFDGTIAVQARQMLEETEWLLALAERHAWVQGVVGWVDLCSAELAAQLERFASRPKLVGVRHVVHDEPDDRFMLRPDFRRGIGRLGEFGLTYDLLLFPRHLEVAVTLVDEFPEQPFVLDHIAKPPIREGLLSPWKEDLERLAERPNVFCKLSGMVTEAGWKRVAARGFSTLPRCRGRGLRPRAADDRVRLARVHLVGRLQIHAEPGPRLRERALRGHACRHSRGQLRPLLPHARHAPLTPERE